MLTCLSWLAVLGDSLRKGVLQAYMYMDRYDTMDRQTGCCRNSALLSASCFGVHLDRVVVQFFRAVVSPRCLNKLCDGHSLCIVHRGVFPYSWNATRT